VKVDIMNIKKLFGSRWKLWLVFAICLVVSQAINLWSMFPEYSGWNVFGFPLIYFQYQDGVDYVYFNIIFFLIDLAVWYLVAKAIIYGYGQLTKFKILK
jgi:hypothetical protein